MDVVPSLVNALVVAGVGIALAYFFKERLDQADKRFDQVDARFAQVDARFDQVDARFAQVASEISALRSDLTQIALAVGAHPRPQAG